MLLLVTNRYQISNLESVSNQKQHPVVLTLVTQGVGVQGTYSWLHKVGLKLCVLHPRYPLPQGGMDLTLIPLGTYIWLAVAFDSGCVCCMGPA